MCRAASATRKSVASRTRDESRQWTRAETISAGIWASSAGTPPAAPLGSGSEADETQKTGKESVPAMSERLFRPIPSPTTTRSGPSPGPRLKGALARKAAIIRRAGSPWTGRTTQVV